MNDWADWIYLAWLAAVLVAVYFYGKWQGRSESSESPRIRKIAALAKLHTDGNNCPPFYVAKEHDYPVLWCPFCGAECRHTGEVVKEANR